MRTLRRGIGGLQLNQIPRDKSCRDPKISETLHQHPCRIAARPQLLLKGLLAGLDSRLEPRRIVDFVSDSSIQVEQKVNRSALPSHKILKKRVKERSGGVHRSIRFKVFHETRRICERVHLDPRFQKKCKWVV